MNSKLDRIVYVTILIAALAFAASAQAKYGVEKKIVFKRGASSTRIVSTLASGREVHEYHFRVKAGQRMRADLVSNDKNISFYIMTIPDGYMMTTDNEVRSFNDTLPDTGEYKLVVSTDTRRGTKYALELAILPK
jgi:hypothetical protein